MSGFIGNTAKIFTGNAVSLFVVLLTLPIITRLFGPEVYGQLVIFNSLISLLVTLTSLGYEKAFLIPRKDQTGSLLLMIALISVVTISCLFEIILLVSDNNVIYTYLPDKMDVSIIYIVPFAVALFGVTRVMMFWQIRKNRFTSQALARVGGTSVEKVSAIGMGLMIGSAQALIYTRISGLAVTAGLLVMGARSDFSQWKYASLKRLYTLAGRFRNFWLSSLSAFLNASTRELPYLIIALMFSTSAAAFFGLARGAIGVPLMHFSDALTRAFYHKIMQSLHHDKDIVKLCSDLLRIMILIAAVPAIVVLLLGDIIVPFIFGDEWSDAGTAIGIVCVSFFSAAIYRPISVLFDMLERQKARVIFNILLLVFGIIALLLGGQSGDPVLAMTYYVVSVSLLYISGILYLLVLVGIGIYKSAMIILKPLFYSVVGVYIPIIVVVKTIDSDLLMVGLSAAISIIYLYSVYYFDSSLNKYVFKAINRRDT